MVNIDGPTGEFFAQVVGQYLHVTGQYHQFSALGFDDFQLLCLGLRFAFCRYRNVMKRHVVAGCELVKIAVVADDGTHVYGQQARLGAKQQIVQAMAIAADHDHCAHGTFGRVKFPVHLERLCKSAQLGF